MKTLLVALTLISCTVPYVKARHRWTALTPEQTSFVYTRCQEDQLPADASRKQYIENWHQWKLQPNDHITQCYTKCVLEGLELYDSNKKKFRPGRVSSQYVAYQFLNRATVDEVAKYKAAIDALEPASDSCSDLFKAYLPVHESFVDVSRKLYHGTVEGAARVYNSDPYLKRKNESMFAFCEKHIYGGQHLEDMCRGRRYELTGSDELRNMIECVFRGLRYIKHGDINIDEIVRDFDLINRGDLEPRVRAILSDCRGIQPYDYYSCLLNSDISQEFKLAFDYRDMRSADYTYLVMGNTYDPAKVKAVMDKAEKAVCG
uniref:Putative long form d7 salivary protein n=1 Tax=Anopheles triannulatus TaxID=58253 RepID=A0A2M4A668_9DIPT